MKDLKLKLPKEDSEYSEEIANGFIDFLKGNSPKLYEDIEREIIIRALERGCDSYHLRRIKEELDSNIKFYADGVKLYNVLKEALKRRNEQECNDVSPDE
jgi:hypothetical protein